MATSTSINQLSNVIHTLWSLELRLTDIDASLCLHIAIQNLKEVQEALTKEREKRILAMPLRYNLDPKPHTSPLHHDHSQNTPSLSP